MIIIRPDTITPAKLTSSNVVEDDFPSWVAGTYSAGDRVIFSNRVWEAVSTTTTQPDEGAALNPPQWLLVGATNRFRMFDVALGNSTERTGTIDITVTPTAPYNSLVLFGVEGATVQLIVRDDTSAIVYDETKQLADYSNVSSYYTFFFGDLPLDGRAEVPFLDIPLYTGATYQLIIDAGAGVAKCAEAVFGVQTELAVTNFGTSVGIKDFSVKQVDDFGNITVVQRPFSKRADFDLTVETSQVGLFNRFLSNIRATPCVYIGDEDREETIVFGYFRDFSVVLANPSISSCALSVEGLI